MELETKRLILRDWKDKDVIDLVEGLNDLEVTKWMAVIPYPYTRKDAEEWIKHCKETTKKGKKRDSYEFAIELKTERKAIGGISLIEIDYDKGISGSGGIWLNAKYYGHGYGTEAWNERARFAFEDLGLKKLENGFFEGNDASKKMQLKLGYRLLGLETGGKLCVADGEIKDHRLTVLYRKEWKRD
jgi:RimJ/RimL family protein N-acetyltransferase